MNSIIPLLEKAQLATRSVKALEDTRKQELLRTLGRRLLTSTDEIIRENKKDLDRMADTDSKKDRLLLNAARIQSLADSLEDIARLPDPANQVLSEKTLENGLLVRKQSVPLGVVGVIYESRPNVTVDVAALCIRSGNACVLRGGTDAFDTNMILVSLIRDTLKEFGVAEDAVVLLPADRALITEMLTAVKYIDIIIPRGSQQLIDHVREHSRVPVIETGAGVCHTYVESSADLDKAVRIVTNAKVSRPSVCNALDTVIVDKAVAEKFLTQLSPSLSAYNVEVFADELAYPILQAAGYPQLQHAQPEDFGREFLDFKCSVKVVNNAEEALDHILEFSSRHSEAIISQNETISGRFLREVDAAAVYVNASTRFTDGGVFGLGAEIGISTQKLHARGPFALEKLVTEKWVVYGDGQVR
ncbi:glutamate-5-semialdehyde dehydrogenase [Chitinophaga barathri]|uniref:Gamma-glutamyl phosphate reductase n=1 Tax=Chitinophaga barathri TaxID=1647451 RepID=A0A3N4MDW6_9BACT|nr:glutamate-5-semialdehyde dehydrogenase [Chitinophaga barathri]RPD41778.1 glutamate-5-semialdehyde dehydrogenase [Chitinophaga barathri]